MGPGPPVRARVVAVKDLKLRLKWRVAYLLNRLKGQCWTDLVCWVVYSDKRSPWSPITSACRADGNPCYCGKLSDEGDER